MEFVLGLPRAWRRHDLYLQSWDIFSEIVLFIPCKKTNDAIHIVYVFFKEVVRLHGLPSNIVLDRDTKTFCYFWKTLWKKMKIDLNLNLTYHPQTDRQREAVNKSLGNLFICLVGEKIENWVMILAQAKFVYNASVNKNIEKTPFVVAYGNSPKTVSNLRDVNNEEKRSAKAKELNNM